MKKAIIASIAFGLSIYAKAGIEIRNMTTEYASTPIGIETAAPHFCWQMYDDDFKKGHLQTAYRIKVYDEKGDTVWDSGKNAQYTSLDIAYEGRPLLPTTQYTWQLSVWDEKANMTKSTSWFETGLNMGSLGSDARAAWGDAKWIGAENRKTLPMLRSLFDVSENAIRRARLYITARGLYDVYINGKSITDDCLTPQASVHGDTIYYQTYDIIRYIARGKNAIGVLLGDGPSCMKDKNMALMAKVAVVYENGKTQTFTTNTDTWQCYSESPILMSGLLTGEIYDATKEKFIHEWSTPWFDNTGWKRVTELPLTDKNTIIAAQPSRATRVVAPLPSTMVKTAKSNVCTYDLGREIWGVPAVRLNGLMPGTRVGINCYNADSTAAAQDTYIARGGEENYQPRFTVHRFRYIEISNLDKPLPTGWVKGAMMHTTYQLPAYYEIPSRRVNDHYLLDSADVKILTETFGIQQELQDADYHHFIISPRIDTTMVYASSYWESRYGRIESRWHVTDNKVKYTCQVPNNSSATLFMAVPDLKIIREGGKSIKHLYGDTGYAYTNGILKVELCAGRHEFTINRPKKK